jgi:uncharacterized repeat protein (TIGR03803 family)
LKGEAPQAGLTLDTLGNFWGTNSDSGSISGRVFKVNISTGALTPMPDFADGLSKYPIFGPTGTVVVDAAGNLWGTAADIFNGGVYKFNPVNGTQTAVTVFPLGAIENQNPLAGVVNDGAGFFWGTTSDGGGYQNGSIFKVDAATGAFTTPVLFTGASGPARGGGPSSGLTNDGAGFLWGTTSSNNGINGSGNGTIFKVHIATGVLTTVADFTGDTGAIPGEGSTGRLLNDGTGFLWGTTTGGGANSAGTIFKVNVATGEFTSVLNFTGTSGAAKGVGPQGLAMDAAGDLWGTTNGGASGNGSIFKFNRTTGVLTTLVEFTGKTGSFPGTRPPSAALALDEGGNFWGMTQKGGATDLGTIFKISSAGVFTSVFNFTGYTGAVPGQTPYANGLYYHTDGNLYGSVPEAGLGGGGVTFRIRPDNAPTLMVDASGNYTLAAGSNWALPADWICPGDLTIFGKLDTAGHRLDVQGKLTVQAPGAVLNATGTVAYLERAGTAPPGTTVLLGDPAHDLLDVDGDGLNSLLEFVLGTDPSAYTANALPVPARASGALRITYKTPVGLTGVQIFVEASNDLVHWFTGTGYTTVTSNTTSGGIRTITVRSDQGGSPQYLRLRATR